jgi:hypothetical protein
MTQEEQTAAEAPPAQGFAAPAAPESLRSDPNPDPKPEALSHDPLAGAQNDPNRVPSAPVAAAGIPHESLYDMAQVPPEKRPQVPGTGSQPPADQTEIKVIDGKEAAATPKGDVGPYGASLPPGGEVAGGNIAKVLDPPPDQSQLNTPLTRERAALLSPIGRKLAGFIQRPVAEWGVLVPGDQIRGHMLLLNLNTGEKVRAMDGHVLNAGELYANLRNLPESLSTGDTIDQVLSASQ